MRKKTRKRRNKDPKDVYIGDDGEAEIFVNNQMLKQILKNHGLIANESLEVLTDHDPLGVN